MVRGNWQKRVETAEARRKEAKQRKQRSGEKRIFKCMALDFLSVLDKNMDAIRRRSTSNNHNNAINSGQQQQQHNEWNFHVWTDSLPSESPPFLDIFEADEGGKSSRKTRSASIDDSNYGGKKAKGRARSGSFQDGAKKVHPRSKEADAVPIDDSKTIGPLLCRSHFFSGKCADPQKHGKKGGCRCVHYNNKQFKTLETVLSSKHHQDPLLLRAEEACTAASSNQDVTDLVPLSMEMVYYLKIPIPNNIGDSHTNNKDESDKDEEEHHQPATISDLITDTLCSNSCGVASIVYVVISSPSRDVLLYDRYQEGMVISDFAADVLGSSSSVGAAHNEASQAVFQVQHLPVSILEHILAYVEAPAVASAARVCTSWHREISHASPNLWKHLLNQRSWPFQVDVLGVDHDASAASLHDSEASQSLSKSLRDEFIKHYSVLRDMRAIQQALTGLLTKKACEEREMTFQAFSTRRGAPQAPNYCVAVEVWGPNQVLAAYSNDCTLRLFQAVPRSAGGASQNEKNCRELVCQSIDPFKHTKKKVCFIEAMGLDEDVVGCLCSVSDETSDCKSPHILVILSRDDLMVVDFSNDTAGRISEPEEGSLHVIDVEEAVLNYILSLDEVDHRLLRLNDFLALGGSSDEIEFIVSQSMAACGYGRFMLEVAISIPADNEDNDEHDLGADMLLLDRKLFLFSSSVGAIVWMGFSNPPTEELRPRLEDMTLASRRAFTGGTRSSCTVAAVSHSFASSIVGCEIDYSGHIDGNIVLGSSEWSQAERLMEEGWTARLDGRRPIVVTATDIVVGDTLTRQLDQNNAEREYKSIITFYSRFPMIEDRKCSISKLVLGENCLVDRMVGFRDDYIIVLCRFFTETGFAADDGGGGHWGSEIDRVARVHALTIHVPSRSEIERLCLYEDFGFNKLSLAVRGDTVACAVWLKGLIMTGSDVRAVGTSTGHRSVLVLDDTTASKASKKKGKAKRRSKGTGKKDGFARGMSLRG